MMEYMDNWRMGYGISVVDTQECTTVTVWVRIALL
jgi:hypothetical protein